MSTGIGALRPASLEQRIARCEKCTGGPVAPDWLPISYYGDYANANAWVVTINPSDREFVDRNKVDLTGEQQRFSCLKDFPPLDRRSQLTDDQIEVALDRQQVVFHGTPYRAFFEKPGRFLMMVHDGDFAMGGIGAFKDGVTSKEGRKFRYSYMDTVKCATRLPWGQMGRADRDTLLDNCLGFTEEQFRTKTGLKLMLINGRTAFAHCSMFLTEKFGYRPSCQQVSVGRLSYQIWLGKVECGGELTDVVGWAPNIVNSRIRTTEAQILASKIREACPALR